MNDKYIRIIMWAIGLLVVISIGVSSVNYAMIDNKVDVREMNLIIKRLDRIENKLDQLVAR